MVLAVEKVGRVPREMRRREETLVVVQEGRGPFPDATVGTFTIVFVETCRSRNRVPIPESNVRTTRVVDVVGIQKEPQLRFGRESAALGLCIRQQPIIRR